MSSSLYPSVHNNHTLVTHSLAIIDCTEGMHVFGSETVIGATDLSSHPSFLKIYRCNHDYFAWRGAKKTNLHVVVPGLDGDASVK